MPMIDVYAAAGTFPDTQALAQQLAQTLMEIEGVPPIPMFRDNTVGFVHELPAGGISTVSGLGNGVRVQVLTNTGALDREKQIATVRELTRVVAEHADDASITERTWVLLTEAVAGGWGLKGHAHTNEELVQAARDEIAAIQQAQQQG